MNKIYRIVINLLIYAGIFILSVILLFQLPPVQKWSLEKFYHSTMPDGTHYLETKGLSISFPFTLKAKALIFKDSYGEWLRIYDVKLKVDLWSLRENQVNVDELSSLKTQWLRMPRFITPPAFHVKYLFMPLFTAEKFTVDDFLLGEGLTGIDLWFGISSQIQSKDITQRDLNLILWPVGRENEISQVRGYLRYDQGIFSSNLSIKEDKGFLRSLIPFEDVVTKPDLNLQFELDQDRSLFDFRWEGSWELFNSKWTGKQSIHLKNNAWTIPPFIFTSPSGKIEGSLISDHFKVAGNMSGWTNVKYKHIQSEKGSIQFKLDKPPTKSFSSDINFKNLNLVYEGSPLEIDQGAIQLDGLKKAKGYSLKGQFHGIKTKSLEYLQQLETTVLLDQSDSDTQRITIEKLHGRLSGESFAIQKPITVTLKEKTLPEITPVHMTMKGGSLQAQLSGQRNLTFNLNQWPIQALPMISQYCQGTLNANGSLQFDKDNQIIGKSTFHSNQLYYLNPQGNLNISLNGDALFQRDHIHLKSTLKSEDKKISAPLDVFINAFIPLPTQSGSTKPLNSTLQMKGNLSHINDFFGLEDIYHGNIDGTVEIKNSPEKPIIQGNFSLKNGYYENVKFGTIIDKAQAKLTIKDNKAYIDEFTGSDRKSGTVKGHGSIDLKNLFTPIFDLSLDVNTFLIIQNDQIDASADGKLTMKGEGYQAKIQGDAKVEYLQFHLDSQNTNTEEGLKIKNLLRKSQQKISEKGQKSKTEQPNNIPLSAKKFPLNIDLNFKKDIQIRGLGLLTFWHGHLTTKGYANDGYLVGTLNLTNGKFNFLGTEFKLSHGHIIFDEIMQNDPRFLIASEQHIMDLNVILKFEGRSTDPKFSITSSPSMPMEEVLARVMFGTDSSRMSWVQGAQLASVIGSMNGKKSLDLMGKLKSFLSIDNITVKENSSPDGKKSQALSVTKQITNKLGLSLEQGASGNSGKVGVESLILPNLKVELDVSQDRNTGGGLTYSKRY